MGSHHSPMSTPTRFLSGASGSPPSAVAWNGLAGPPTTAARLSTAAFVALALLLPIVAHALPVDVTARADKQQITVGDILTYHVEALCAQGTTVSVPEAEKRLAPFELRDVHREDAKADDGRLKVTFTYQLTVFETGEKMVSGLKLQYQAPGAAKPAEVSVPGAKVTVASVLPPDAKDIMDIREPVAAQMGPEQWLAAALIALAILVPLALLGYLLYRRLSRPRVKVTPQIVVAAHEHALAELGALRDSDLLVTGQYKVFYTRLSEIVREYLEARYGVPAMEQTTWMIDRDLQREKVPQVWRDELVGTLRRADLVKFARQEVDTGAASDDLRRSREAVQATGPQPTTGTEEAVPQSAAG